MLTGRRSRERRGLKRVLPLRQVCPAWGAARKNGAVRKSGLQQCANKVPTCKAVRRFRFACAIARKAGSCAGAAPRRRVSVFRPFAVPSARKRRNRPALFGANSRAKLRAFVPCFLQRGRKPPPPCGRRLLLRPLCGRAKPPHRLRRRLPRKALGFWLSVRVSTITATRRKLARKAVGFCPPPAGSQKPPARWRGQRRPLLHSPAREGERLFQSPLLPVPFCPVLPSPPAERWKAAFRRPGQLPFRPGFLSGSFSFPSPAASRPRRNKSASNKKGVRGLLPPFPGRGGPPRRRDAPPWGQERRLPP